MEQQQAMSETRRVVEAFVQHLGAGNFEAVAHLFAETIDWRLSWPDALLGGPVPWIRVRHGRADIGEHYASLAEHNAPYDRGTTIERIVVDGNEAVLLGTIRNVLRATGIPYIAHFAMHLTVEDGAITRQHVYEDSLSVMQAWESGSPDMSSDRKPQD